MIKQQNVKHFKFNNIFHTLYSRLHVMPAVYQFLSFFAAFLFNFSSEKNEAKDGGN